MINGLFAKNTPNLTHKEVKLRESSTMRKTIKNKIKLQGYNI